MRDENRSSATSELCNFGRRPISNLDNRLDNKAENQKIYNLWIKCTRVPKAGIEIHCFSNEFSIGYPEVEFCTKLIICLVGNISYLVLSVQQTLS